MSMDHPAGQDAGQLLFYNYIALLPFNWRALSMSSRMALDKTLGLIERHSEKIIYMCKLEMFISFKF